MIKWLSSTVGKQNKNRKRHQEKESETARQDQRKESVRRPRKDGKCTQHRQAACAC